MSRSLSLRRVGVALSLLAGSVAMVRTPLAEAFDNGLTPAELAAAEVRAWGAVAAPVIAGFEPNAGQFDPRVDQVLRAGAVTLFVSGDRVVFDVQQGGSTPVDAASSLTVPAGTVPDGAGLLHDGRAVEMRWRGANGEATPRSFVPDGPSLSYFLGNASDRWATGARAASIVQYDDLVGPNDVRYLATPDGLRYDVLLEPGSDPAGLLLDFTGASSVGVDDAGDLVVGLGAGDPLRFSAPVAFQDVDGRRVEVTARFALRDDDTVGFDLGPYDPERPLVIDPSLDLGTYLGGTGVDRFWDVALGSDGSIYTVGESASVSYPTTLGAYQGALASGSDIVVSKLSADGSSLLWSTYLGGSGTDVGKELLVTPDGDVVLVGHSSSANFPTTAGAYDETPNSGTDAVIVVLDGTGTVIDAATVLGSTANDYAESVDLDPSGNIVVGGTTYGAAASGPGVSTFPVTAGAWDTTKYGGTTESDGFVAKLPRSLASLSWSTYVGEAGDDVLGQIDVDAGGAVYVTTSSAGALPTSANAFDATNNGGTDTWVGRIAASGASLEYGTWLGGSGNETGASSVRAVSASKVYVGTVATTGFPTTALGQVETPATFGNALAVLDPTASGAAQLRFGGFLGIGGVVAVNDLATDPRGRAYLTGAITTAGLGTVDAPDTTLGGAQDGVLTVLDPENGGIAMRTYIGGNGSGDVATSVVLTADRRPLVAGSTNSSNLPTSPGAYDTTFGGAEDGFVQRYSALPGNIATVDDVGDGADAVPGDGTCATASATCTLRAAVEEANATDGIDTVRFAIPAGQAVGGVYTVNAASTVQVTAPLTIDATSQSGFTTTPVVVLDGASAVAGSDGLRISATGVTVRGLAVGRFPGTGIEIAAGASSVLLEQNHIGTDAAGTVARANGQGGVAVLGATSVTVGSAGKGNVISGNTGAGVAISASSSSVTVRANRIGVPAGATTALANTGAGVSVAGSTGVTIGGTASGAGNVIAHNGAQGVTTDASSDSVSVVGNSIHANTGLGFDIAGNGVTANDASDTDSGPNGLLNFPVITAAVAAPTAKVTFTFDGPVGTYRMEFFTSSAKDPSNYGEGETFKAATTVVKTTSGSSTLSVTLPTTYAGAFVTGVAHLDGGGGTYTASSEFSAAYTVTGCVGDADADALCDTEEDLDADADADPATNPAPDTDNDGLADYLDDDDDGDGVLTVEENADPNGDGDPRDARDGDRDGQPDHLDAVTGASDATVTSSSKLSDKNTSLGFSPAQQDYAGNAVSAIGDVDHDGVVDLAIGSLGRDDGGSDRGAAYVLFMNADRSVRSIQKLSSTTGGLTSVIDDFDFLGSAVAGLGDVDGDGIGDLAVTAPGDDDGGANRGAVYVLLLNATGTVKTERKISDSAGALGLANGDRFGASVTGMGDVDGDGVRDLAVGATGADDGGTDRGAVYVLLLNSNGTLKSKQKISATTGGLSGTSLDNGDFFGVSVGALGDLDGDGARDLIVGAAGYLANTTATAGTISLVAGGDDDGGTDRGALYVLLLNGDGTVKAQQKISDTAGSFTAVLDDADHFGSGAAGVGDVDGDGVPDAVVGALGDDDSATAKLDQGAAYVLLLNTNGTVKGYQKIADGVGGFTGGTFKATDRFGAAVAGTGDLDGNGSIDIAVGTPLDDDTPGANNKGAVYLLGLKALAPVLSCDDHDLDVVCSANEDADTDGDGNPATNPGPDTDGDGLADYLDDDDDGDGKPTTLERADGNGDGNPRDAYDSDRDGEPDYLDRPTAPTESTLLTEQKVSDLAGGLTAALSDGGGFAGTVAPIGDLDRDGVTDLVVGARYDDDGGTDQGAVYVLFLNGDGTVKAEQKISDLAGAMSATFTPGDEFGAAVAGLGDLDGDGINDIAVGAPYDDDGSGADRGAVYVLFLNRDGTVKRWSKLSGTSGGITGDPLDAGDLFGSAVAGLGDFDGDGVNDLLVGAPADDDGGTDRGAAYVLFLTASGTVRSWAKISDTAGSFTPVIDNADGLGSSVATLGDVDGDGVTDLALGAPGDDDGSTDRGAVYVLLMSVGGSVRTHAKLSDLAGGFAAVLDNADAFGRAVGPLGDLDRDGTPDLVVGAPGDDDGGTDRGAAYVLLLKNDGTVKAEQKLSQLAGNLTRTLVDGDAFGAAVAGVGDLDGDGTVGLVIGATGDDDGGTDRGAIAVYDLLVGCVDADGDGLCSKYEDTNADGDNNATTNPAPDTDGDGTKNYLDADDDGDGVPTASENADPNGNGDPRDALDSDRDGQPDYLDRPVTLAASGPVATTRKVSTKAGSSTLAAGDGFGASVVPVGDLDRDGVTDVAVGAPGDDTGGTDRGAVYVLLMNADGTVRAEKKLANGSTNLGTLANGDAFGSSVAGIGDLDGDGVGDLVVGAPGDDTGASGAGAVYVLRLNGDGSVKAKTKLASGSTNIGALVAADAFGASAAGLGDLDGDGLPDVVVGASGDDTGASGAGAVHVLRLNADGTVKARTKLASGSANVGAFVAGDGFGSAVAGVGDVDGDGVPDLVVGAPGCDDGGTDRGAVHVLRLTATGSVKAGLKVSDTTGSLAAVLDNGDQFGAALGAAGDLDRDGVNDVAVGAKGDDDAGTDRGAVYLLRLDTTGAVVAEQKLSERAGAIGFVLDNADAFGSAVAGVGDLDGDGTIGLIVGVNGDDDGAAGAGAIVVFDLCADRDLDGLCDSAEDANTDADSNPATSPGPDTDGDGVANYLDVDDDGDGTATASESADRNDDGRPADAADADRDGQPDYLDAPTVVTVATVRNELKVSDTAGGLTGALADGDTFGRSVAAIGDLDGDGHVDLAVGAPGDDTGGTDRGAVHVLFLGAAGTVKSEQKLASGTGGLAALANGDGFGTAVTAVGDVDGDGIVDLVVGAPNLKDSGNAADGGVFVLFMRRNGTVRAQQTINQDTGGLGVVTDAGDRFGGSVAGLGDVDGDGIVDLAVGASGDDDGGTDRGALYVLLLKADGTVRSAVKTSDTAGSLTTALANSDGFGSAVAGLGDVNGDGVADVAVGVPGDGAGDRGAVFVLRLAATGAVSAELKLAHNAGGLGAVLANGDQFGYAVGAAGDLDRNGVPDLLVGTYGDDDGGASRGAFYVLSLDATGSIIAKQKVSDLSGGFGTALEDGDLFGAAVAGIGDYDGDGTLGLVVAAVGDDDGGAGATADRGAVYVLDLGCVDDDSDGLCTLAEEGDHDGDGVLDYLDADDDGDGVPTSAEGADPNGDGDPRDAADGDGDGQPDYLDLPTDTTRGNVADEQKISHTAGGKAATLEDADSFGRSVASVGDIDGDGVNDLVVGAVGDDDGGTNRGAVYVLFLNADGTVRAEQKISDTVGGLQASLDDGDGFGVAVAGVGDLDGDGVFELAVGADGDDDGGSDRGALYVLFVNPDGTVRAEQKVSDLSGGFDGVLDNGDRFGAAVARVGDLDGDGIRDIVAGSRGDDDGGANRGAVYVLFLDASGSVSSEQKISVSVGGLGAVLDDGDQFGASVSGLGDIDGDGVREIAVGAVYDDDGGTDRGAVYVLFMDRDGTTWSSAKISDTSGGLRSPLDNGDWFGSGLARVGDLNGDGIEDLAVGAMGDDDGSADGGAVYLLFLTDLAGVRREQKISDTSGGLSAGLDASDYFGQGVAGLGDLDGDGTVGIAVAARGDDDGGANRGAVYVLDLAPPCDDSDVDGLCDIDEDLDADLDANPVTSPAPDSDGDGLADYLDDDDDGDAVPTADERPDPDGDGDPRDAYDNDRDGIADYLDPATDPTRGGIATHVRIGSAAGGFGGVLSDGDQFGSSVAAIGDLDRDGVVDLVVGVPKDDEGGLAGSDRGGLYVVFLQADGTVRTEQKIASLTGGYAGALDTSSLLGASVAAIGDLDGDGVNEVAVGVPRDDDGTGDTTRNYGAVEVLFLNPNGTVRAEQTISPSNGGLGAVLDAGDLFGSSVTGLGDLDGDGIADLAVGAPGDDDGDTDRGAVYVLLMNADATVRTHQKISDADGGLLAGLANLDRFGTSVAAVGDLDADGAMDVVVGADGDDDGGTDRGALYVLFLYPDGRVKAEQKLSATSSGFDLGLDDEDGFGSSVAGVGDLDGDGVGDVAVGAPGDDDGGTDRGAVFVLFLDADGTVLGGQKQSDTRGGLSSPLVDGDRFGSSVAGIGDLDGDGTIGLVVGARAVDLGGTDRGALFLVDLAAGCADGDGDGLCDDHEDRDADLDGNPATNPGPDRDGDGLADYLDDDDDDDLVPTADELADTNGDGDPRDAADADRDGVPDYLDAPTGRMAGQSVSEQKVSSAEGGKAVTLDPSDGFGASATPIGDLDGDGVTDLVVGAPGDDDGGTDRGALYVLFLNATGTVRAESKVSAATPAFGALLDDVDRFGASVGSLGDLDGDGRAELVVGAPGDDDGGTDRGALYVLFLHANGTVRSLQKVSATSGAFTGALADGDGFGSAVSGLGDLDGDGFVDLVVGAPGDDDGGTDRGALYVLRLDADGTVLGEQELSGSAGSLGAVPADGDGFGSAVSGLGDLDGDGFADVVVGAPGDDDGGSDRGALYVVRLDKVGAARSAQKVSQNSGALLASLVDGDGFGSAVSGVGDIDDDGTADIVVGAPGDDDGGSGRGAFYVLMLQADGTVLDEQKVSDLVGGFSGVLDDGDGFGSALVGVGDLDGDSTIGLVVGVPADDDRPSGVGTGDDRGAVWVLDLGLYNTAPVLNSPATPFTLGAITEDEFTNDGDTVATLLASRGGDPITDADGDPDGIMVTGHADSAGWFEFSTDAGVSWTPVTDYATGVLLRPADRLRYVPAGYGAEAPSLQFRAWDQSVGGAGEVRRSAEVGGVTPVSAAEGTITVTVTAVADGVSFGVPAGAGAGDNADTFDAWDLAGLGEHLEAVVIRPDGSSLAAGHTEQSGGAQRNLLLLAHEAGGPLDTTFGTYGYVTARLGGYDTTATDLVVLGDGSIMVTGHVDGATRDVFLARFDDRGVLDTTFGGGDGWVAFDLGGVETAAAMLLQSDGKLVVAGAASGDLLAVRFLADGSLDPAFDGDGWVVVAGQAPAADVARQSDGKLVLATSVAVGPATEAAVLRLTAAGVLDASFSGDGVASTAFGLARGQAEARAVAVQADGRIVVTGASIDDDQTLEPVERFAAIAVARFDASGSPDSGFGGAGWVRDAVPAVDAGEVGAMAALFPVAAYDGGMDGLLVEADGSIVVVGSFDGGFKSRRDVVVARYLADGSPDTTFDTDGVARTATGRGGNALRDVVLDDDGVLVAVGGATLAGGVSGTLTDALLVRYDSAGSTVAGAVGGLVDGVISSLYAGPDVVLDRDVRVFDKDLIDAVSWSGVALTISRAGGASAADGFVASGALSALTQGGPLVIGGVTVGTVVTNGGGVLQLVFGAGADAAKVDAVLESIAYRALAPTPVTATLNWVFDDGTGAVAEGTTVVTVVAEISPVVNSTGDTADANPGDLICDTGELNSEGDPACTLRAALEEANVSGDAEVSFAIPESDPGHVAGVWTIELAAVLPTVTASLLLDATGQTGWAGLPVVVLDGAALSSGSMLDLRGNGSSVLGLQVQDGPAYGIRVSASTVTITSSVVTANGGAGVAVVTDTVAPTDVAVVGNSITGNGGLGIDLGGDGITANDSLDVDSGPNDLLNAPVITAATVAFDTVTVDYLLDVPAGTYRVEFFTNADGGDPSGRGEGETLVLATTVTHNGGGPAAYAASFAETAGASVTMTVTEVAGPAYGSTSEFSVVVVSVSPGDVVEDRSIRRSDLREAGGATIDGSTDGVAGAGLGFNGGGERLVGPATDLLGSAMTMSAWVRLDAYGTAPRLLAKGVGGSGGTGRYELYVDDVTTEAVAVLQVGSSTFEVRGGSVGLGAWHQVAATWDGSTLRLVLDGTELASTAVSGSMGTDLSGPLVVGNNAAGNRGVSGALDRVEVAHVARSVDWLATAHANLADPAAFVSMGSAQSAPPGAWTVTPGAARTGGYGLAAPTGDGSSDAWVTASGVDEPGVEFSGWWKIGDAGAADLGAGTRAGGAAAHQLEAGVRNGSSDLVAETVAGSGSTRDATAGSGPSSGQWARVTVRTDETGWTSVRLNGSTVIAGVLQPDGRASGTVGLRSRRLALPSFWFIDDLRVRRLVSDEPVTTLGWLQRRF
jgi:uncharacterized delta-60 repeat protein/CSLREA domain-containing protein